MIWSALARPLYCSPTAQIKTLDPMRSWKDESLLRRSQKEDSPSHRAARHVQVPGCPTLRRQPLLGQALRLTLANQGESLAPRKGGGRPPKPTTPYGRSSKKTYA